MIDFADVTLLASISTEPLRDAAVAILANIMLLAIVGALGYGVFLWGLSAPRAPPSR